MAFPSTDELWLDKLLEMDDTDEEPEFKDDLLLFGEIVESTREFCDSLARLLGLVSVLGVVGGVGGLGDGVPVLPSKDSGDLDDL